MTVKEFVIKAIEQDSRNVFESCNDVKNVPDEMLGLYKEANPIDVELNFDGTIIRLFPYGDLDSIQNEYAIGEDYFVFADSNGDPVYLFQGKVYIGLHGTNKEKGELLAESLFAFFDLLN